MSILNVFKRKDGNNNNKSKINEDEIINNYLFNEDPALRIEATSKLSKLNTERSCTELIETIGFDDAGEVRIAAMIALLERKDKSQVVDLLKTKIERWGDKSTSGGNPKVFGIVALSLIKDMNITKAIDFDFNGKENVQMFIDQSNYNIAQPGIDRTAFFMVWFTAIDGGKGRVNLIDKIEDLYKNQKNLIDLLRKWMLRSL